jgi:MYXO-CTERM domain-containing protein
LASREKKARSFDRAFSLLLLLLLLRRRRRRSAAITG